MKIVNLQHVTVTIWKLMREQISPVEKHKEYEQHDACRNARDVLTKETS